MMLWMTLLLSLQPRSEVAFLQHSTRAVSSHSIKRYSATTRLRQFFCNQLEDITSLQNDYCALRHGQSMANVAKIIASNPDIACTKYGLSDIGKAQAAAAGRDVVDLFQTKEYAGIAILTSDLLRAKETAQAVRDALQHESIPLYSNDIIIETKLRERGFGEWDGGSDEHYHDVWADDVKDPTHEIKGVESVVSVMGRATSVIVDWEKKVQHHLIICVAHGDVLQILQTGFCKMDASLHRSLDHLETAKLRPLQLKN